MSITTTCQKMIPGEDVPCIHLLRLDDPKEPSLCKARGQYRCIESMKRKLPHLSFTTASMFASCKMKFFKSEVLGVYIKDEHQADALRMGSIWDKFLESKYSDKTPDISKVADKFQLQEWNRAKLNALARAHNDLEIKVDKALPQHTGFLNLDSCAVKYKIDRAYEDHIVESKLTTQPERYFKLENIQVQVGTYLMGNDEYDYAIIEATRTPGLRQKKKDETIPQYEERIYQDIISRPTHYFPGFNRKNKTYGRRFYRNEFDLGYVDSFYRGVYKDLRFTLEHGNWYRNEFSCHDPFECDYIHIKTSGGISDEIYRYRQPAK